MNPNKGKFPPKGKGKGKDRPKGKGKGKWGKAGAVEDELADEGEAQAAILQQTRGLDENLEHVVVPPALRCG